MAFFLGQQVGRGAGGQEVRWELFHLLVRKKGVSAIMDKEEG